MLSGHLRSGCDWRDAAAPSGENLLDHNWPHHLVNALAHGRPSTLQWTFAGTPIVTPLPMEYNIYGWPSDSILLETGPPRSVSRTMRRQVSQMIVGYGAVLS